MGRRYEYPQGIGIEVITTFTARHGIGGVMGITLGMELNSILRYD